MPSQVWLCNFCKQPFDTATDASICEQIHLARSKNTQCSDLIKYLETQNIDPLIKFKEFVITSPVQINCVLELHKNLTIIPAITEFKKFCAFDSVFIEFDVQWGTVHYSDTVQTVYAFIKFPFAKRKSKLEFIRQ
jgi:hypothetical protein